MVKRSRTTFNMNENMIFWNSYSARLPCGGNWVDGFSCACNGSEVHSCITRIVLLIRDYLTWALILCGNRFFRTSRLPTLVLKLPKVPHLMHNILIDVSKYAPEVKLNLITYLSNKTLLFPFRLLNILQNAW